MLYLQSKQNDPLHSPVQQTGEAAAPEVVRGEGQQGQEENHPGVDGNDPPAETEDVQLYRVQRHVHRVQALRQPLLLFRRGQDGQRARGAGGHPQIRRGSGQILRICL